MKLELQNATAAVASHDQNSAAQPVIQRRLALAAANGLGGGAPTGKKCFVYQDHYATAGTTWLLVPIGGDFFATYIFATPSAHPVRTLLYLGVCKPFVQLSSGDVSVTQSGTWTSGTNSYGLRGGSYWHASTTSDYVEFTFTGSSVGMWQYRTTNGGYGVVSIDGDATAANKLPVVTQALVDSGDFAAGDLGKRYINSYSATAYYDQWTLFADGLTEGAHTIRITPTGTKPAASSAYRVYISMFGHHAMALAMDATDVSPAEVCKILWPAAVHNKSELSAVVPVCAVDPVGFVGELHGRETQVSFSLLLDGVDTTPDAGTVTAADEIVIRRVSTLTDGASKQVEFVANKLLPGRLAINVAYSWSEQNDITSEYCGMLPTKQYTAEGVGVNFFSGIWSDGNRVSLIGDGVDKGYGNAGLLAFYSDETDFVPWLSTSRASSSFNQSATATFANDRVDLIRKWYSSRPAYSVEPGTVQILQSVVGVAFLPGFAAASE